MTIVSVGGIDFDCGWYAEEGDNGQSYPVLESVSVGGINITDVIDVDWLDKIKTLILPPTPVEEGSMRARFQPMLESALTEKAITNFFNDIVAFYLVKVHWELITKRWLKEPAAFSNAWLTVFYMIFLLIRYRKSP